MNRPRPCHHWCGRRVMCDECYFWDFEEAIEFAWDNGGAESLAVAYLPEGL